MRRPSNWPVLVALGLTLGCDRPSAAPVDAPEPEPAPIEPAPTEPAPAPTEPEQPTAVTSLSAGVSTICEPVMFGDCPADGAHAGVDETLEVAPTGTITVAGVVEETDTRCTKSMPPSCMSSLALRDRLGGPGRKLVLTGPVGGTVHACYSGANRRCCTLATDGSRYAVTGTLQDQAGVDTLMVDSVCRLR